MLKKREVWELKDTKSEKIIWIIKQKNSIKNII
jgi:hypothetical protein